METDKNYFLVGLFVIIMVLGGIGFTLWLTSAGKGGYDYYRIYFAESVSGLNTKSAVKFRGVDVGNVE
jgi:phospholipid/cholesterol/gamma-HCH transport system substrate-binding protein